MAQQMAISSINTQTVKTQLNSEANAHLQTILGFSQLLQTDNTQPLSEKQAVWVGQIYQAGKLLLNMVNDVLESADFAEIGRTRCFKARFCQDLQDELAQIESRMQVNSKAQMMAMELLNQHGIDLV
jgi:hypothetical protein